MSLRGRVARSFGAKREWTAVTLRGMIMGATPFMSNANKVCAVNELSLCPSRPLRRATSNYIQCEHGRRGFKLILLAVETVFCEVIFFFQVFVSNILPINYGAVNERSSHKQTRPCYPIGCISQSAFLIQHTISNYRQP